MTKWTQEPWSNVLHPPEVKMGGHPQDWEILGQDPDGKFGLCQHIACVRLESDGHRITSCINALAGLNPEGVKELVEAVTVEMDFYFITPKSRLSRVRTALAAVRLKDAK